MKRVLWAVLALGTLAAPLAAVTSAEAQVPPRNGPYGDRDGIPNAYDRHDNRRANNGAWGDKDHDGVPQAWDRNDRNPYQR